jgi:hypothetical protein
MACSTCNNTAGLYNIVADQGATLQCTIVYKDAAKKVHNVGGYAARMHVRTQVETPTTILELTTENGRITVDGPNGRFDLTVSATDMTGIPAGMYVYDLEVIAPVTGVVDRLIQGNFVVRSEVTR